MVQPHKLVPGIPRICRKCYTSFEAFKRCMIFCSVDCQSRYARHTRRGLPQRANSLVAAAVASGDLVRHPICEKCGRPPLQWSGPGAIVAHHEDYAKPLDVVWLCRTCHKQRHKFLKEARPAQE